MHLDVSGIKESTQCNIWSSHITPYNNNRPKRFSTLCWYIFKASTLMILNLLRSVRSWCGKAFPLSTSINYNLNRTFCIVVLLIGFGDFSNCNLFCIILQIGFHMKDYYMRDHMTDDTNIWPWWCLVGLLFPFLEFQFERSRWKEFSFFLFFYDTRVEHFKEILFI